MTEARDLAGAVQAWDEAAWCLAALALATGPDRGGGLTAAAAEVLAAAGLVDAPGEALRGVEPSAVPQVGSAAAAPLHQTAALLSGRDVGWAAQSDESLLAQGRASGRSAQLFTRFVLSTMDGLGERLSAPGARMLDVGTGVGALAVAYAEAFPELHVVGIDVLARVLDLAAATVAASAAGDRVSLRRQDVADLTDDTGFDLAWIPAPFIPEGPLRAGLPRVVSALRPGGWVVVGHGILAGDPVQDALTRLKTVAFGGTPLDGAAARGLLEEHDLTSVATVATPPGAPGITVGRSPARS